MSLGVSSFVVWPISGRQAPHSFDLAISMEEPDDPEAVIAELLEPYPEEIRSFARELRSYLKEETKPTHELAGRSAQSFNIGYGFNTTSWDCFCAIIVYRNHINLSFPSGAKLEDPEGLLHGTGTRVRHMKIREVADLQTPEARALLDEARSRALDWGGEKKSAEHEGVKTIVKRR